VGLTRRHFGCLVAALYFAGGLLLLADFMREPAGAGAHLPLAWHVFPASLVATLAAATAGFSAPLDPVWYVTPDIVAASYVAALTICTWVIFRVIAGPLRTPPAETDSSVVEDIER